MLGESLLAGGGTLVPESTRSRLLATFANDLADLLPALRERGEETLRRVKERLADRGRSEADDLQGVLLAQKARIEAVHARHADPQLELGFADDEKRQLAADRRHQERRLAELERELATKLERRKRTNGLRLPSRTWRMRRGEVWWVNFEPSVGGEVRKKRPAVIVINDASNQFLIGVQVIPITSNADRLYPSEAYVSVKGQRRKAMADQLTTVSKERLSTKLCHFGHSDLEQVERPILVQLGLALSERA